MVRDMSIQHALEWAFAVEHARIDFDELGSKEFERVGVDSLWILQQQHRLGCRVDGGGSSDPHPDAQIIAAAVEALPGDIGGKNMALVVAECARARSAPNWRAADRRGVVPCGWDFDENGLRSAHVRKLKEASFRGRRSRVRTYVPTICPISYTGTAASIAKARRDYLDWYGALLRLLSDLSRPGLLTRIRLTKNMPELSPWKSS